MKQSQRRLLSLLLVLAMCFSLVFTGIPSAAAADYWWTPYVLTADENVQAPGVENGQVASEGSYILFTSDLHRHTYLLKDLLDAANGLVHADGAEGNVGLVALGGDMANEKEIYPENMTIIKHAIADFSPGTVATYTKGNHEANVSDEDFKTITGMSRIGETAVNKDGLYHFFNFGMVKDQAFEQADIDALAEYLASLKDDKPVFVVSHFPIHFYNDHRSCKKADVLLDLLNQYPQVVFGWGHNHTENDPAYGTIRFPGDVIQTGAGADSAKEINFTYMSLGAMRDGINDANGVLVRVGDDGSVNYRYIDLGLSKSGEIWTDAQGNNDNNDIRLVGEPRVSSEVTVPASTENALKTIHNAQVFIARPLVDKAVADSKAEECSDRFHAEDLTWTVDGAPLDAATFDFDTEYTATVKLAAEEGYSFDPNVSVTINPVYAGPMDEFYPTGRAQVLDNDGATLTVSITFPKTVQQLAVPLEQATTIEQGHQYVLVTDSAEGIFAVYYRYVAPGEESKPDYSVHQADAVIRDGKLVSEVDPFTAFTAARDCSGYLLYSDASLTSDPDANPLSFLDAISKGPGGLQMEAAPEATLVVYNNWFLDEDGNPYLDVDGVACYACYEKGKFAFKDDKAACNVKLYDAGKPLVETDYVIAANVTAPETNLVPGEGEAWEPAADPAFAPDTAYTITVTVPLSNPLPKGAIGRVNGNTAELKPSEDGSAAVLTYTFPATNKEMVPVEGATTKKADAIESGKSYVIVADGKAMTNLMVDGLYLAGAPVTVTEDAITDGLTENMIFTLEGSDEDGYSVKGADAYLTGKGIPGTPETWGIEKKDQPGLTVTYEDGSLVVKSTGAGGPGGGPGGPPPGGPAMPTNTFYVNDGHFHFSTLKASEVTLYEVEKPAPRFTDIEGHWAEAYINDAVDAGLFKGTTDTTFEPESPMNRAMVVTTLYRMAGEPAVETESDFTDVPKDEYYTAAVNWAVAQKITNGTGDNKFEPEKNVSRQDFTTFLVRYANSQGLTLEGDIAIEFKDADKIADYAKDAVDLCVKAGIINGKGDGIFDPKGDLTRAECAKMLVVFQAAAK